MDIAMPAESVMDRLEHRVIAMYTETIQELAQCLPGLTRWEEAHLLGEAPSEADKAAHQAMVQHMLRCARFLSVTARQPEFPDRKSAELLAAVETGLEFKLQLWHRPPAMTLAEAEAVLNRVFPEPCLDEP